MVDTDPPAKPTRLLKAGDRIAFLFGHQYLGKISSIGACHNQCKPHQTKFHEAIASVGQFPAFSSEESPETEEEAYRNRPCYEFLLIVSDCSVY